MSQCSDQPFKEISEFESEKTYEWLKAPAEEGKTENVVSNVTPSSYNHLLMAELFSNPFSEVLKKTNDIPVIP